MKTILIENDEIKIMNDFTVIKKSNNNKYILTKNLTLDNKKTDVISIFKIINDSYYDFINYFFLVDLNDLQTILDYTTEYLGLE